MPALQQAPCRQALFQAGALHHAPRIAIAAKHHRPTKHPPVSKQPAASTPGLFDGAVSSDLIIMLALATTAYS